jgi:hypothetical protein
MPGKVGENHERSENTLSPGQDSNPKQECSLPKYDIPCGHSLFMQSKEFMMVSTCALDGEQDV